jgi:RNA polymerase sigma factor (TIGR02999 family)
VPEEVTQLLLRWNEGDGSALDELLPIVYNELRRLARSAVRRDGRESILQPTALVHEVWLRLSGKERLPVECRGQFYALTAKVMRDILVDRLRRRHAAKRGGIHIEVPLDDAGLSERPRHIEFLILHEAMTRLGQIKPRYMQVAELRYLTGLTIEEAAEVLKVSHATLEREWGFARAWLQRELRRAAHDPSERDPSGA